MSGAPELPGTVLFACTMNSVRSPMAAALLRHLAGQRIRVESAGVREGEPDGFVATIMGEIGIDLAHHRPRALEELGGQRFDLILTLSPEAHHTALELTRDMDTRVEYWPTLDATVTLGQARREDVLACYRSVREELFKKIRSRFGLQGGPSV